MRSHACAARSQLRALRGIASLKPKKTKRPSGASRRRHEAVARPPTESSATSTPRLPTSADTSVSQRLRESKHASAPSSRTTKSRFRVVPAVPTTRMPWLTASCTAAVPTPPPAPKINAVSLARARAASKRQTHAVRNTTGKPAASAGVMPSGYRNTCAAGTTMSCA